MKKLFCVLVCLVLTAFALVSCGDVDRSDWLGQGKDDDGKIVGGNYNGENTIVAIPEVNMNLYIIVEDETWDTTKSEGLKVISKPEDKIVVTQAINTVSNAIKDYTSTTYKTVLNVKFVKASEYETVVLDAVKAGNSDANAANIVLVNSYALMQDLYATGKLVALDSYLDTSAYGQLNTNIPTALLEASKLDGKLYSIPNNHVIGNYEYLLINKEAAKECKISDTAAKSFTSYDDVLDIIDDNFDNSNGDLVALVSGSYEDRFLYEAQGYYCNVVKNPIADKNEAFSSAFAIINRNSEGSKVDMNERAMQIIYDLNMMTKLRNILQYGVAGTNYKLDSDENDVVSKLEKGPNLYSMNLIYTGNTLNAFVCEEIGWTDESKANTIAQNADSITIEDLNAENNGSTEE